MIPKELETWKLWVDRLGLDTPAPRSQLSIVAQSMTATTVSELAEFCVSQSRGGGLKQLKNWLQRLYESDENDSDEEGVRNLFRLFRQLGIKGIRVFKEPALQPRSLPEDKLRWTKLPASLQFLIEPALEMNGFQYIFSDEGRDAVRAAVSEERMRKYSAVGDGVRRVGIDVVQDWCSDWGVAEHREAAIIFNAIGVLDALGIRYYE